MTSYYIGIRVDRALILLGNGPRRMSSLLKELGLDKEGKAIKPTVGRLAEAGILALTHDKDPIVSLTLLKYAHPPVALREYKAYRAEKRKQPPPKPKADSMTDDIITAMATQGAQQ